MILTYFIFLFIIRVVFFMIRVDLSPILFYFYFFTRSELVRVDPSWSDPDWRSWLIRSDFCTRLICHCDRFIFCILLWVHHNSMLLTLRKKFICLTVLHTVFVLFASQLTAALPFSMRTSSHTSILRDVIKPSVGDVFSTLKITPRTYFLRGISF